MFAEIMQPSTKTSFLIKDLLGDVLINREGKCILIRISCLMCVLNLIIARENLSIKKHFDFQFVVSKYIKYINERKSY